MKARTRRGGYTPPSSTFVLKFFVFFTHFYEVLYPFIHFSEVLCYFIHFFVLLPLWLSSQKVGSCSSLSIQKLAYLSFLLRFVYRPSILSWNSNSLHNFLICHCLLRVPWMSLSMFVLLRLQGVVHSTPRFASPLF